jgi:hypothetical protein
MRIRTHWIAAASAAVVGAALFSAAIPADAATTFPIWDNGGYFLHSTGVNGNVDVETSSSTEFEIYQTLSDGYYAEYEDTSTHQCLDNHVAANRLVEANCKDNDENEEFYYGDVSDFEMINDEDWECMNAIHNANGSDVDFVPCPDDGPNNNEFWFV